MLTLGERREKIVREEEKMGRNDLKPRVPTIYTSTHPNGLVSRMDAPDVEHPENPLEVSRLHLFWVRREHRTYFLTLPDI
jgi:hypothetical protein